MEGRKEKRTKRDEELVVVRFVEVLDEVCENRQFGQDLVHFRRADQLPNRTQNPRELSHCILHLTLSENETHLLLEIRPVECKDIRDDGERHKVVVIY